MRPEVEVWFGRRTYRGSQWSAGELTAIKQGLRQRVSVVLPARDEQDTVAAIVAAIRRDLVLAVPLVDELVVIDSHSTDATAAVATAAGATVVAAGAVLPQLGDHPGKGEALWKSLAATTGDLVVFLDADLRDFPACMVTGLLGPLLTDPGVAYVKGMYERPLGHGGIAPAGGGRVTELVARPLLNLHWPALAGFVQPLSGEYAGRRAVLEQVPFMTGYGVELALLVDLLDLVGLDAMAQVDLGRRIHRNQPDAALSRMASIIWQTALDRLQRQDALTLHRGVDRKLVQFQRDATGFHPASTPVTQHERPPMMQAQDRVIGVQERARAALVSFRLGGSDGVAVESTKWATALGRLGMDVRTVAGTGKADHLVSGLELDAADPVDQSALGAALVGVDLVVVENICSLPRNLPAAQALARVLAGRATVLHHHDLPWQRPGMAVPDPWPLTDPAWRHVTINTATQQDLLARGIPAACIPNTFDPPTRPGRRAETRRRLQIPDTARLVLQPTRALPRKGVPQGLALAEHLDAVYWLTGAAEDGYQDELDALLATASTPIRRRLPDGLDMADAYAACDVVAFPSTWEGFGNPVIESALHHRPLVVADYPVLHELAGYGLRWFGLDQLEQLRRFLADPDPELLSSNAAIGRQHFASSVLETRLRSLFLSAGWGHLTSARQ